MTFIGLVALLHTTTGKVGHIRAEMAQAKADMHHNLLHIQRLCKLDAPTRDKQITPELKKALNLTDAPMSGRQVITHMIKSYKKAMLKFEQSVKDLAIAKEHHKNALKTMERYIEHERNP